MPDDIEQGTPNTVGRPKGDTYTPEVANELCSYLSMGYSLRKACDQEGMPSVKTVFNWLHNHGDFLQQYARAKEEAADAMAEDILDIADESSRDTITRVSRSGEEYEAPNTEYMQRSKLRIDTRKWLMAKYKAKKYGDKIDLTTDGNALPTPIYGGLSGSTTPESRRD